MVTIFTYLMWVCAVFNIYLCIPILLICSEEAKRFACKILDVDYDDWIKEIED